MPVLEDIKELLFSKPLNELSNWVLKNTHTVTAKDFQKAKQKHEDVYGNYNKVNMLKHIKRMEEALNSLIEKKEFPPFVDIEVSDIEYDFLEPKLLRRFDKCPGYVKFDSKEIPDILHYFRDAGFDIEFTANATPFNPLGMFTITFHYDDEEHNDV